MRRCAWARVRRPDCAARSVAAKGSFCLRSRDRGGWYCSRWATRRRPANTDAVARLENALRPGRALGASQERDVGSIRTGLKELVTGASLCRANRIEKQRGLCLVQCLPGFRLGSLRSLGRSWASAADHLSPWLPACGKSFRSRRVQCAQLQDGTSVLVWKNVGVLFNDSAFRGSVRGRGGNAIGRGD